VERGTVMPRWAWGVAALVLLLAVGSCVGLLGYVTWHGSKRQASYQAHTRELQALLEDHATTTVVQLQKGPPLLMGGRGKLSLDEIPGAEQLPSPQDKEAGERLAQFPTSWVYRHDDALEILFFDERGRLAAFNRCLL
jgi:hypothetical protein